MDVRYEIKASKYRFQVLAEYRPQAPNMSSEGPLALRAGRTVHCIDCGILILIVPRILNYIVAIYLILIGLIGIFGR